MVSNTVLTGRDYQIPSSISTTKILIIHGSVLRDIRNVDGSVFYTTLSIPYDGLKSNSITI